MAPRVPGLVKLFFCIAFLQACAGTAEKVMPVLNAARLQPVWQNGLLQQDGKPLTARIYSLADNNRDTASIACFVDGKENGTWKKFYPGGRLAEIRSYANGMKTGNYIAWWPGGKQKHEYHFKNGEFEGVYREWTDHGVLIKEMNYVDGHETGNQKQFFNDGTVKANYTIIEGRRYGLLGTKNCINVSDSIFKK
jgi:antitoxin component YwqK of YwqJK toxin-antitoxin module